MSKLEESIISAAHKDCFLDAISDEYLASNRPDKELGTVLARLHNSGKIDLIAEYKKLNRSDQGHDCFMLQHVFGEALPTLEAETHDLVACIKHLIIETGDNWLITPFTEFCKAKSTRPQEVVDIELEQFDKNLDLLSSAIFAGSYFDLFKYAKIAIHLMSSEKIEITKRAIFSIGRIDFQDESDLVKTSFNAILESSKKWDCDEILSTSLRSLFYLTSHEESMEGDFVRYMKINAKSENILFTHAAIDILFRDKEKITKHIEKSLLDIAKLVKPENKGSINQLDLYLADCIKKEKSHTLLSTLETIFENTGFEVTVNDFDSVERALMSKRHEFLSSIITRWMLYKKVRYGRACHDLLRNSKDIGIELSFDMSQISNNANHHLFLSQKACGWFFTRPLSAISLIVSLVESCPHDQLDEISELVFNPLLISYPGSVKDYLIKVKDSSTKKVGGFCSSLLDRLDKYHEGLESAFTIKEFRPSEEQKFTYRKHHQRQMNEIMKESRKGSFLADLFQESILLYGRKSIHYIHHGKESTRQEVPLQTISHSIEFPSLHNLDPHGLEDKLRWFRVEGCHL